MEFPSKGTVCGAARANCDEVWVLRNRALRTVSDPDGSSTKEHALCAVRLPRLSNKSWIRPEAFVRVRVHGLNLKCKKVV